MLTIWLVRINNACSPYLFLIQILLLKVLEKGLRIFSTRKNWRSTFIENFLNVKFQICVLRKKKFQICVPQKGETWETWGACDLWKCRSSIEVASYLWVQNEVDRLVFSPFSYWRHYWAKSKNMNSKSKLNRSPEMYARQRHIYLSFFYNKSTPFPERKVTRKFPSKGIIIWAS